MNKREPFYLVRKDLLTDAMKKTLQAKELIETEQVSSVLEAVQKVDLSRSAFYKYRDAIFPFHTLVTEQIITLFIGLEHKTGTLSNLLTIIAQVKGNILTINQTIPLQGKASITLSIDIATMNVELEELMNKLEQLEAVTTVKIVGSGF